ncbi:TIGR02611 family protein [Kineococcus rhizosphaerae]|uniref:Uncharacterized protein (TIGR02611 family) n=1 Tax=Kineococcus rhizosphaerae TaxID=559628 RepID=A0A2T0R9L4_9ACTN|nr:TIGR02611 family protein [Kineococcus rhizosphaerae]PRY17858.1 uncharacterized protein (TIGR02611 family) [Kineococcus rhizosphaerae]
MHPTQDPHLHDVPEPPAAAEPVREQVAPSPGRRLSAHDHRVRRARARWRAWRERVREDPHRDRVYRAVVGAVGTVVVVLGLVLVPLPGPGWLVVFGGLAVLATEFSSARRLKHFGERQLHRWGRWIAARSLATRAALGAGTAAAVAGALWGYLAWQGLPGWTPEVVTAQLQWVPGL